MNDAHTTAQLDEIEAGLYEHWHTWFDALNKQTPNATYESSFVSWTIAQLARMQLRQDRTAEYLKAQAPEATPLLP